MSETMFGGLVKAVVDVNKDIIMVDAQLHADEEYELLEQRFSSRTFRGNKYFPEQYDTEQCIVFDSMINVRALQGNKSRGVDDTNIQQHIKTIVHRLVLP